MKVSELIERLSKLDPEKEIMILDGSPRDITCGPVEREISLEDIEYTADCEEFDPGTKVYVIGCG